MTAHDTPPLALSKSEREHSMALIREALTREHLQLLQLLRAVIADEQPEHLLQDAWARDIAPLLRKAATNNDDAQAVVQTLSSGDISRIALIEAKPLPFFGDGTEIFCLQVDVEREGGMRQYRSYLYDRAADTPAIAPVDINSLGALLNASHESPLRRMRDRLTLSRHTVAEYITFTLPVMNPGVWLIGSGDEVQWLSPLYGVERMRVNAALQDTEHPEARLENDQAFLVTRTALSGTELHQLQITVYKDDYSSILTQRRRGEMTLDFTVRVAGLPDNWFVPYKLRHSATDYHRFPIGDGWDQVMPEEASKIIDDINRRVFPLIHPERVRLLRKPLPFYPGATLLQVEETTAEARLAYLVWMPGKVWLLDWSSLPIHSMNRYFNDTFNGEFSRRLVQPETAREYVRFFGDFVAGDNGPFTIIEAMTHPRIRSASALCEHSDTDPSLSAQLDLLAVNIRPIEIEIQQNSRRLSVTNALVWYGKSVFLAQFVLTDNGEIEMTDDEPVIELAVEGESFWHRTRRSPLRLEPHPIDTLTALTEVEGGLGSETTMLANSVFFDRISLKGRTYERDLVISNCRFRQDVDLSAAQCAAQIHIENCVFEGALELTLVTAAGGVSITGCTFLGSKLFADQLDARLLTIEKVASRRHIYFLRARIQGAVRFEGIHTGGSLAASELDALFLTVSQLDSHSTIAFLQARIEGAVHLGDIRTSEGFRADKLQAAFLTVENFKSGKDIDFQHARIRGAVHFDALHTQGGLRLDEADIRGGVNIRFVKITTGLLMDKAVVGGGIEIAGATGGSFAEIASCGFLSFYYGQAKYFSVTGITVDQQINMQFAVIEQSIYLQGNAEAPLRIRCRHATSEDTDSAAIDLYGIRVRENYVAFSGIDLAGDVDLTFARIGTGVFFRSEENQDRCIIRGSVNMGGLQAPGGIFFEGTSIGKRLDGKDVTTGHLRLVAYSPKRPTDASTSTPPSTPVEIGDCIHLPRLKVAGHLLLCGVSIADDSVHAASESHEPSVDLRGADISGDCLFFMPAADLKREAKCAPSLDVRSQLPRGIHLQHASIGGTLDISHVECRQGTINLSDARIGCNTAITIHNQTFPPARARHLHCNSIECSGDMDFSGLQLRENMGDPGSIRARRAIVKGELLMYRPGADSTASAPDGREPRNWPHQESYARVPGCLDLTSAQIDRLRIARYSFEEDLDKYSCKEDKIGCMKRHGVILNQAKINHLYLISAAEKFPCPVGQRFMEVTWWDFDGNTDKGDNRGGKYYVDFLGKSPEFMRHNYHALEQTLFNRGLEDAANEVHKAMHRELDRESRASLSIRRPLHSFSTLVFLAAKKAWGWTTGYGTSSELLTWTVGLWLVVSSWIFAIPLNIAPSEEGLAATNTVLTSASHPANDAWGWPDGFWMALRYHIPVVGLGVRDEWELANESPLVVVVPWHSSGWAYTLPITPEDYAFIVAAMHWIFLPFILIILSRKVLRRRPDG